MMLIKESLGRYGRPSKYCVSLVDDVDDSMACKSETVNLIGNYIADTVLRR
jgi:hypothetical protein